MSLCLHMVDLLMVRLLKQLASDHNCPSLLVVLALLPQLDMQPLMILLQV